MSDFTVSNEGLSIDFANVADAKRIVNDFNGKLVCDLSLDYKAKPAEGDNKEKRTLSMRYAVVNVESSSVEGQELPKADDLLIQYYGLLPNDKGETPGASAFKPHALALAKKLNISPTLEALLSAVKNIRCTIDVTSTPDKNALGGYRVDIRNVVYA